MSVCLYVWVTLGPHEGRRRCQIRWRWIQVVMSCLVWARGTELGPSRRTISSLNHWTVSLTLGVLGLVTGRFNQCGFLFMALRNAGFCSRCISPCPLPILLQCRWVKWVWNQTSPLSVLCQNLSPWFSCKSIVSSAFWGEWARGLRPHTCTVACGNAVSVSWGGQWSFWDAVSSSWQHLQCTRWLEGFLFYLCVCVWCLHMSMHVWMDVHMCVTTCVCRICKCMWRPEVDIRFPPQSISAWFTEARPLSWTQSLPVGLV